MIRSKYEIEKVNDHESIVITEIPYMVVKSDLIKKIAELVNAKKLDGITNLRDESDKDGMRIVIEIRKDAIPNVVLNHLFKNTQLQSSFGVNNIALVGGRPKLLNLKDIIQCFVEHRHDVVVRRAVYEKRKAEERAHILRVSSLRATTSMRLFTSSAPQAAGMRLVKNLWSVSTSLRSSLAPL